MAGWQRPSNNPPIPGENMNPRNPASRFPPFVRPLLLGAAIIAGIVVGLKPAPAAEPSGAVVVAQAGAKAPVAPEPPKVPKLPAPPTDAAGAAGSAAGAGATKDADPPAGGQDAAADATAKGDVDITIDGKGIRVEDGRKKKRVHVGVGGANREYDSFEEFVHQEPWIGALVFGIVTVVFMVPVLITGLFIWYKLRRTRMMNETMVKLAEHGVRPTDDAVSALAAGQPDAAVKASVAATPIYEQAKLARKGLAWSDLRKGVIMFAVGLAFTFYSMLDDGSPNWIGLLLLFLGIAYCGLWFFESRAIDARARMNPPAGGA
jgi:hypothetical protein